MMSYIKVLLVVQLDQYTSVTFVHSQPPPKFTRRSTKGLEFGTKT